MYCSYLKRDWDTLYTTIPYMLTLTHIYTQVLEVNRPKNFASSFCLQLTTLLILLVLPEDMHKKVQVNQRRIKRGMSIVTKKGSLRFLARSIRRVEMGQKPEVLHLSGGGQDDEKRCLLSLCQWCYFCGKHHSALYLSRISPTWTS